MKKQFSIIAMLGILTIAACKKNNDATAPPPPQGPAPQIASIKQTISGGNAVDITKTFVYDAENRLKEIKHTGANNITERYNYTGNPIQYRYFFGTTEMPEHSVNYTLNNNDRVETLILTHFNVVRNYEYNNSGYITRINYALNGNGTGYNIYHYSNSMALDSISFFSATSEKVRVQVFTYETGKKNTIGSENQGLKMLGKDQAAPLKSKTLFELSYSRIRKSHNDYSYLYRNDGRIVKLTNTLTKYANGVPVQTFIEEELEYTYK
jgi:hypothetical protein